MFPHRKAPAVALVAVMLALGSAVSGCSGSGGTAGSAPLVNAPPARTTTTYTASRTDSGKPTAANMQVTADRLRKRAKALGLKDTDVRVDGTKITVVALPADEDRMRRLTQPGVLEFRPVLDPAGAAQSGLKQAYDSMVCDETTRATLARPERPTVACDHAARQKYLLGPTALGGADVESASAQLNSVTGSGWLVNLAFSPAGSNTFTEVTGTLAQHTPPANQFAVVIDGGLLSAPAVHSAITGGKAQITGRFTKENAQDIAAVVSSGALPVQLTSSDSDTTS